MLVIRIVTICQPSLVSIELEYSHLLSTLGLATPFLPLLPKILYLAHQDLLDISSFAKARVLTLSPNWLPCTANLCLITLGPLSLPTPISILLSGIVVSRTSSSPV